MWCVWSWQTTTCRHEVCEVGEFGERWEPASWVTLWAKLPGLPTWTAQKIAPLAIGTNKNARIRPSSRPKHRTTITVRTSQIPPIINETSDGPITRRHPRETRMTEAGRAGGGPNRQAQAPTTAEDDVSTCSTVIVRARRGARAT